MIPFDKKKSFLFSSGVINSFFVLLVPTKPLCMNRRIDTKLNRLDNKLSDLLTKLQVYSDDQLNRTPNNGKWSVLQNMHHLILAENSSQQYLQKKLSFNPQLKKAGIGSKCREWVVRSALASPFKYKAPAGVSGSNLPENTTFWETAKMWKQQREDLKAYLEGLPPNVFALQAYKHPVGGRMSIGSMLGFFETHFNLHHKYINKIIKDLPPQKDF